MQLNEKQVKVIQEAATITQVLKIGANPKDTFDLCSDWFELQAKASDLQKQLNKRQDELFAEWTWNADEQLKAKVAELEKRVEKMGVTDEEFSEMEAEHLHMLVLEAKAKRIDRADAQAAEAVAVAKLLQGALIKMPSYWGDAFDEKDRKRIIALLGE